MSQTQPDRISLPPRLRAALERYRNRVWTIKVAEGALAAVFGLGASYLTVFGLDRWIDTSAVFRGVILAVGSVGLVIVFPLMCYNWVWRQRQLDQVARLVRHKSPRFGDQLLGIVELAHRPLQPGASRTLIEAAMRQVDAELDERNLGDAVLNPRHRRWAWAAGVPLALIAVVMIVVPAAGRNALVRWAMPWRDVGRYTFAQLQDGAGLRVVPYAEAFRVEVSLNEDSPWKPEAATARFADQPPIVSVREGMTFSFQIPPQTRDGRLSLQVGDARLTVAVEPRTRPALAEFTAQVRLPAYLQRPEPLVEDVRGGTVSLVQGSTAIFQATATRDLAMASLNDRPQPVDGSRVTTESVTVDASTEYHLSWRDRLGLDAREPQRLRVEAFDDREPTVGFKDVGNNRILLSSDVLAFEIQAGDDFGVRRVGLEWEGIPDPLHNPEPARGEKMVAAGSPVSVTMTATAAFLPERENVRPQSLRLRAFAEDYLPNRERAYSTHLVVHVLTPEQHFNWLTEQMRRWAGAAQEVYEKELQLHHINQELMNLPPDVLDDPAQQNRLQNQAAAEKANAARLEALIDLGKALVRDATRNEEFGANQLESWAEILRQLEEIAGKQMPAIRQTVAEQRSLLDAFARVAGEMNELLQGFENSTFVKRLKAASRKQVDLATDLNHLDGFGLEVAEPDDHPKRRRMGELEAAAAETVFNIQEDLHAYANRRPAENYVRVLNEMRSMAVVDQIRNIALALRRNEIGQSTIEAEFWGDTLDRWAEQLVDPRSPDGQPSEGESEQASLTPEIVLAVLRVIHREIGLREATRELDQARVVLEEDQVREQSDELRQLQAELARTSRELAGEIRAMIDAADQAVEALTRDIRRFAGDGGPDEAMFTENAQGSTRRPGLGTGALASQMAKLISAAVVMDEVEALLGKVETGPPTIAAIAEVIEILLDTVRAPNPPTVVEAQPATAPALVFLGLGDDGSRVSLEDRAPGQATGKSGRILPEEFRQGLDVYLNALEGKPTE